MFEKVVVVDCRNHLMGRLASVVAKELLNGQKVVLVRTEEMNISGSLFRNKLKWAYFVNKRTNINPKKGPLHYRNPSRMTWRIIRGMIPHKTPRGVAALERLKVFEGVPPEYTRVKRKVIPAALRNLRLKPNRKYCRLGDLASAAGWKHDDLIKRLEAKRKTKAAAYFKTKSELQKLKSKANDTEEVKGLNAELAQYGF